MINNKADAGKMILSGSYFRIKILFILKKTGCNLQKMQFPIYGNHKKVGFSDIRVNTSI